MRGRDAEHLARLLRMDEITPVRVPSIEEETARDLVRSLRSHRGGDLAFRTAFDANYEAVIQTVARRDRLDQAISQMAADSQFTPLVNRLGCLRGIGPLTGFALAVEITDRHRFTGNTIGSFLGLVPAEYSSGQSRQLGGITQLSCAAAPRRGRLASPPRLPAQRPVRDARPVGESPLDARLRGQAGNERLHHQWVQFTARKKRPVIANIAVARELAGWCWSLAVMDG